MNKTIIITGATTGFGRATALKFAENGFNIIITGRRKKLLDELENELRAIGKTKVLSLNFDVRKKDEVESAIGNLGAEWKKIDILVNNAISPVTHTLPTQYSKGCFKSLGNSQSGVMEFMSPEGQSQGKERIFLSYFNLYIAVTLRF